MTNFSTTFEGSVLQALLNGDVTSGNAPIFNTFGLTQAANSTSVYMSLHTGYPDQNGANEVTTTDYVDYARSAVLRAKSVSAGTTSLWTGTNSGGWYFENAGSISFNPCGTGTNAATVITHWGMWDASASGNFMCGGPLIASGAIWYIGCVTDAVATTRVYSRAHSLAPGDIIRMYPLYNGLLNSVIGGTSGFTASVNTVGAGSPSLYFDIGGAGTVDVASFTTTTSGAFALIKSSSITLAVGKVPTIPALGLRLRLT